MMKAYLHLFLLAACCYSSLVFAHGVHETNFETSAAEKPASFLDFFIADLNAKANVEIDERKGYIYIESDGLADHATGKFPNPNNPNAIAEQNHKFRVTLKPRKGRATDIKHAAFGVAINGVPFDPSTAEFWNRERGSKWNYDAINGGINLGLDQNNAHVQPNGAYHYHGIPVGLMERGDQYSKPVMLGYAADGFPIYGPYGYEDPNDMNSKLINLFPSYRVKEGNRQSGPRAKFDGTYTADYEYVKDLGDLDKCNGRSGVTEEYPQGTYHYVITDAYPFIPRCWMGKADKSFQKRPDVDRGPDKEERGTGMPKKENKNRVDMRKFGIASRDAESACAGRRAGNFCSFRSRNLNTVNGTCRGVGAKLVCIRIDR